MIILTKLINITTFIMNHTLKLFNTGQITLPKSWRDQFQTKNFLAKETREWLLIQPIGEKSTDINFYENSEWFGIYSEWGINPEEIIRRITQLQNG